MRTTDEARRLLARYVTDLALDSLEPMEHTGWGGDSDVFLVDGTHVFRIARFEHVRAAYTMEERFLAQLATWLNTAGVSDVAVPRFTHIGRRPDGPPLFVGYPLIAGRQLRPALLAQLDVASRDRIAAQLAAFLSALHAFPVADAAACGLEEPRLTLRDQIGRQHERISTLVYPRLDGELRAFLDATFDSFFTDPRFESWRLVPCHGDLSSDHLLVTPTEDGGWRLAGVIDWSDARIGDASGDLYFRTEYGESFFREVFARYECPVPDRNAFVEMLRLRMGFVPTAQIAYGLDTRNEKYVDDGIAELRDVMRRLPARES